MDFVPDLPNSLAAYLNFSSKYSLRSFDIDIFTSLTIILSYIILDKKSIFLKILRKEKAAAK
ncbi:hypothetical protein wCIFem_10630 [Wolbachia pipientis]